MVVLAWCFRIACDPCSEELGRARRATLAAVSSYDAYSELVLLARLRCGFVASLVTPLVPEYKVCSQLAEEYAGMECLQLDLDDF